MSRAVLFPGQGAQFVGMSADLVERFPATGEMFESASRLLGTDLLKLCADGPEDTLNSTAISQPAIFVVSLAVVRGIQECGGGQRLAVAGTAGLSLGEYSALVFAGAMSFDTALEVVVRRGEFMQEACDRVPSGMTSLLGLDLGTVSELVEQSKEQGVVAVASVNAARQIVISGDKEALARAAELALERGARKAVPLRVAGAYHSPLMASASDRLRPYLERAEIRTPRIPFYPNVSARRVDLPEEIRAGLLRQIVSPVLWAPTLETLAAAGMDTVLQPGPGKVIAGLVRQASRDIAVESVLTGEQIAAFAGGE